MNYKRIIELNTLKVEKKKARIASLEDHLMQHPNDYQARIASITLMSSLLGDYRELGRLDYLNKVNQYK